MKIFSCLNRDIVSSVALNLLLPSLSGHEVQIGLSSRIGGAGVDTSAPRARNELRVAEQALPNDVLFPLVERAGFSDDGARFLTFDEIERHRGIAVVAFPEPNKGDGLALVERFDPDLVLSIRYGSVFRAPFIAVPRLGVLNLHAGLLPAYRGVIATFRALMNDDAEVGCTLHYIADASIDTGPIVGTTRVAVDRQRSLFGHVLALYPPGVELVANAIDRLARGDGLTPLPQTGGAYYSYPSHEEWEEFARRGWRTVDPNDLDSLYRRYLPRDFR